MLRLPDAEKNFAQSDKITYTLNSYDIIIIYILQINEEFKKYNLTYLTHQSYTSITRLIHYHFHF